MTLLPIVERELLVTARRAGVYRNRFLTPAVLLVVIMGVMFAFPFPSSSVGFGRLVYGILAYLAFVVCILEGARQTADCLSVEKREGTLGLLFLTDLNGYDVILGKLAAASLASFHSLLAMVPILGCALFLGGVTPGEIVRMALALISLLSFSLAVGLWVSSRSRSASHAMGATILLIFAVLFVPWPLEFNPFCFLSPAWAFFGASASEYSKHPLAFWASLWFAWIFVLVLLGMAAVNTNRFREDDGVPKSVARALARRQATTSWNARGIVLDRNPLLWLAGHGVGAGMVTWILVLGAVAAVTGFLIPQLFHPANARSERDFLIVCAVVVVVHLVLKVFLAARACHCISEARRNSTLELLLCTPLKVEDILRGQVLALKKVFLKPFLVVLLMEMICIYWWLYSTVGTPAPGRTAYRDFGSIVIGLEVAVILFYLLDLQGVAWTGFWFGLCSKNESAATFKTAFYVILVPILLLVLYCLGMILFVVWPIAAYVWARLQLQEHFRYLAGQRLISGGNLTSWLPLYVPNLPQNAPPD